MPSPYRITYRLSTVGIYWQLDKCGSKRRLVSVYSLWVYCLMEASRCQTLAGPTAPPCFTPHDNTWIYTAKQIYPLWYKKQFTIYGIVISWRILHSHNSSVDKDPIQHLHCYEHFVKFLPFWWKVKHFHSLKINTSAKESVKEVYNNVYSFKVFKKARATEVEHSTSVSCTLKYWTALTRTTKGIDCNNIQE